MIPPPAIVVTCPALAPFDVDRIAECIRQCERIPGQPYGKDGERGDFQFKEDTWKEQTELPFSMALNPAVAYAVARARILHIRALLLERRLPVTAFNIAMCWKVGISGAILRKYQTVATRDYCIRVENLYVDR
jgi:hypothetical protein